MNGISILDMIFGICPITEPCWAKRSLVYHVGELTDGGNNESICLSQQSKMPDESFQEIKALVWPGGPEFGLTEEACRS